MVPKNINKTTMMTKNGLFEWLVMLFGLENAIGNLSKVMNEIFKDELDGFVKVFIDDLNIHARIEF